MDTLLIWETALLDPVAAVLILVALFGNKDIENAKWLRFGLILSFLGLCGQGYRSYLTLTTGIAPRDDEIWLWALKDLGLLVIACVYALPTLRRKRG